MFDSSDAKAAAARKSKAEKDARLAEQLRANLQRRKAQARARRSGQADLRSDGLLGSTKPTDETS